jgi:hypothetical protein
MAREFTLSPQVVKQAEALGFYGDSAEALLKDIARRSVKVTHPRASHRFREYLLNITPDRLVVSIEKLDEQEAEYLTHRKYDERKAAEDPGEATVEPYNKYRR